jgi:hypothetical protein
MVMAGRLGFVVAGDTRAIVEMNCGAAVWRCLADNGFVERASVSCVGFHREIDSNSLVVVLPKAFNLPGVRARLSEPSFESDQIYRLIRVFRKIRREARFSLGSGVTNKLSDRESRITDPVLDSFDAAIQLRRDFRENGLYVRKDNRHAVNMTNQPVHWHQTIRRSSTMISGQDLFFDKTFHKVRKRHMSHPLCLLHVACLKEIFALVGERSELEGIEALDEGEFMKARANPRGYLRDLRASTFDERGRFLIGQIASFLGESSLVGSRNEVREDLLSYSKDFEDIWERILRDLMAPGLENRDLPAGEWYGWPDAAAKKGIQPEFDIRLESPDSSVLVDAKDYRILSGSRWLGSSGDHYKQIIYRKLMAPSGEASVVNILAFPALGQRNLFEIRGCHRWAEVECSQVFEVTVDYDLAVRRWLNEASLNVRAELQVLLGELRDFGERIEASVRHSSV